MSELMKNVCVSYTELPVYLEQMNRCVILVVYTPKEKKKSVAINTLNNASIYKFIHIMTPISFPFITAFVPFGTHACIIKVLQMPANII